MSAVRADDQFSKRFRKSSASIRGNRDVTRSEERFALLVDQQWLWKENRAFERRLRAAHFKERGVIEDVDYQHPRGLDRKLVRTLSSSDWVRQHQSVLLLGPTGIGKTWLACALAQKACRDGFSVLHKRTSELFRELAVAHADGRIGQLLAPSFPHRCPAAG
jgi:DNA replication protein DnaC